MANRYCYNVITGDEYTFKSPYVLGVDFQRHLAKNPGVIHALSKKELKFLLLTSKLGKFRRNPLSQIERKERVSMLKHLRDKLGIIPTRKDVQSHFNIDETMFYRFFKHKKYRVERRCHVFYEKRVIAK